MQISWRQADANLSSCHPLTRPVRLSHWMVVTIMVIDDASKNWNSVKKLIYALCDVYVDTFAIYICLYELLMNEHK